MISLKSQKGFDDDNLNEILECTRVQVSKGASCCWRDSKAIIFISCCSSVEYMASLNSYTWTGAEIHKISCQEDIGWCGGGRFLAVPG
jgi:hypothetical protein